MFKNRVSNKVPSKIPKSMDYRVVNPMTKKGKVTSSPTKNRTCGKCGNKHYIDCLKGTKNCFGCDKSIRKVRNCPIDRGQYKGSVQAQEIVQKRVQRRTTSIITAVGVSRRLLRRGE